MRLRTETEAEALFEIIVRCSERGEAGRAEDSEGLVTWRVEADTKVDPDDRYYPVIVHQGQRP